MVVEYEVVLATYNGEKYLEEQLDSIASQTFPPIRIIVSDDCSTDNTVSLIKSWSLRSAISLTLLDSEDKNLGCVKNFEKLLKATTSNYVMLSDQDDIWDFNKSEQLIAAMSNLENSYLHDQPLLIHSDSRLVDDSKHLLAKSYFEFQKIDPQYNDWLSISLQNVVTGCTCLINKSCIEQSLPFPKSVVMHDWWLAMIASRQGKILCLNYPLVSYRQHSSNVVGVKSFAQLLTQIIQMISHRRNINQWVARLLSQLQSCHERYPLRNSRHVLYIQSLTHANVFVRLNAAISLSLAKQGILRTVGFYLSIIFFEPVDS